MKLKLIILFILFSFCSYGQIELWQIKDSEDPSEEYFPLTNLTDGLQEYASFSDRVEGIIYWELTANGLSPKQLTYNVGIQSLPDATHPLKVANISQDDTQDRVVVIDANGVFYYRDASTIGGGLMGDGVINGLTVTGTSTKTITASRSVGADITADFTDEVDDADADPQNEIQDPFWNDASNTLSLTNSLSSTTITGFLESEVDGDITNELQQVDSFALIGAKVYFSLTQDPTIDSIDLSSLDNSASILWEEISGNIQNINNKDVYITTDQDAADFRVRTATDQIILDGFGVTFSDVSFGNESLVLAKGNAGNSFQDYLNTYGSNFLITTIDGLSESNNYTFSGTDAELSMSYAETSGFPFTIRNVLLNADSITVFNGGNGFSISVEDVRTLFNTDGSITVNASSANNYTLPNARGTNGQVLKTDGSGNVTFQDDNVNDGDFDNTNEFQDLSISGSGANLRTVEISDGTNIQVAAGTGLDLSNSTSSILAIDVDPTFITDDQNLESGSFNTTNGELSIGIEDGTGVTVDLDGRYLTNEVDGSITNELVDDVSWHAPSSTLTVTDSGADHEVILSSLLDNTDNQDLSLSGNTLSLTGDATSVDLSGFLDNTDNQVLSGSIAGGQIGIFLEDGTNDLLFFPNNATANQVLSWDGSAFDWIDQSATETTTTFTDLQGGDLIATYTNEDGATFAIAQSVTSMNNTLGSGNRIGTHINEQSFSRDIYETVTDIALGANTTSIDYTGEDGVVVNVDLSGLIDDADADPNNEIELPSGGTNGQILSTNGSGVYSWVDDQSGSSLWSDNGSDVYRSSGFVGIGTSTPARRLHVNGNPRFTNFGNASGMEIGEGNDQARLSYIDLHSSLTTGYTDYTFRIIRNSGDNGSTQLLHKGTSQLALITEEQAPILFNTNSAERMRILGTGNVGIGTSSPNEKLHVNGGLLIAGTTNTTNGTIRYNAGLGYFEFREDGVWNNISASGTSPFSTSGTTTYLTNLTDDLSIGTSGTVHKLTVNDSDDWLASFNHNVDLLGEQALIKFSTDKSTGWAIGLGTQQDEDWLQITNSTKSVFHGWHSDRYYPGSTSDGSSNTGYITGNGTELGIGMTEQAGYKLSVLGDVDISAGVKIGSSTSTVAGNMRWDGTNFQGHDGTSWINLDSQGASVWTQGGSNQIYYDSGVVGVGSSTVNTNYDFMVTGITNLDSGTGTDNLTLNSAYDGTGSNNTFIGKNTGNGINASGDDNVVIGANAFDGVSGGSGNVVIGANVYGSSGASWSNKLLIDNSTTLNPLIEGDFSTNELEINGGLTVTTTSSAFYPPQMTTTQRDDTVTWTPSTGAVIWNTTTTKLQVYNGTIWIDLH